MTMHVRSILMTALGVTTLAVASGSEGHAGGALGLGPDWQVGGFVFVAPKYEGSKDYEVGGAPFIAPAGTGDGGWVQFRGPDDLRFRAFEFNGFEAGPLVGWRFDREDTDARRLRGLGDVDGGLVLGGYAAFDTGLFKPFLSYHHGVTGDDTGALLRFGAEAKANMGFAAMTVSAGASYADDDFMDAYFSVTPGQSTASAAGLGVYDADAGVKDVFLGISGDVPLNDVWTLKVSGKYSRLVGDAADSPIVESENQFFGGLGLSYRFSVPH